jgi:hypothetical protein
MPPGSDKALNVLGASPMIGADPASADQQRATHPLAQFPRLTTDLAPVNRTSEQPAGLQKSLHRKKEKGLQKSHSVNPCQD